MSALTRLWFVKLKATIRNLFRKPSSAILTVFMILVYGFLIITALTMPSTGYQLIEFHTAILMSIGFTALMAFSLLLQKRKALFYENDSFYLFCGPFSRSQVMRCLMAQSTLQAFLFSCISTFMLICFGMGAEFSFLLVLFTILGNFLALFFFMTLTDYLYILGISDPKNKKWTKIVAALFILILLCVFVITLSQNHFDIENGLIQFAQSDLFYVIPVFGWIKMLLITLLEGQMLMSLAALGLLLIANIVVAILFISFKGDFYEQAMMDATEISAYMNQVKAGKKSAQRLNAKVHDSSIKFRDGAGAIFSKNLLMMKKTRDFISMQDIGILVFYFLISLFTEAGFGMYAYMLIIWIFQVLQTSDLVNELKNYQIYLIPAKPFAKLWYAILPTLIKIVLLMSTAVVIGGVFYRMPVMQIIQYWIMLIGYAFVFVSGTVLSIRILKSRTNMMLENMMRMLIVFVCSLPGIIMTVYMITSGNFNETSLMLSSNLSLITNIVLSLLILFGCKNMMNGRELNSD